MLKETYISITLMVSMLILSFSSCSNDELLMGEEQTSKGTLVHMVATANASIDTPDTRTTRPESSNGLDFRWAEGDQLLVTSNTGIKLGVLTLASGIDASQGTFSGEVYIDGDGQEINIFYLGSATNTQTFSGTTFIDDLSTQEGTFESLPQKDFMAAKTTVSLINGQASVNFNIVSQLSFAHYTLNGGTNVSFDGVEVTISGTNLYNEVTFNLANGGKNMKQGSIKAKAHGNDLYIILGPAENVELTFNAIVNGKEYAATLPSHTYKENRYFATGVSQGYEVEMQEEGAGEWVDLGLTSGTLWASKNIGADEPYKSGNYYGWGDVTGQKTVNSAAQYGPSNYNEANYSTENTYGTRYYWQCCATESKYGSYDIAAYQLGEQWTMPTPDQVDELIKETTYESTTLNSVRGFKFINKKDESKWIFIPAAGYKLSGVVKNNGYLYAWTSEIHWYQERLVGGNDFQYNYVKRGIALTDYYDEGSDVTYGVFNPAYGFPVRPVRK